MFLGFACGSTGKESTYNVGDLGWEDPLEKGEATYSSILAWRIQSMESQKVGHDEDHADLSNRYSHPRHRCLQPEFAGWPPNRPHFYSYSLKFVPKQWPEDQFTTDQSHLSPALTPFSDLTYTYG